MQVWISFQPAEINDLEIWNFDNCLRFLVTFPNKLFDAFWPNFIEITLRIYSKSNYCHSLTVKVKVKNNHQQR